MIQVETFWVVTPSCCAVGYQRFGGLHSEDGVSKVLRNVSILPQHYTTQQPRKPTSTSTLKWK